MRPNSECFGTPNLNVQIFFLTRLSLKVSYIINHGILLSEFGKVVAHRCERDRLANLSTVVCKHTLHVGWNRSDFAVCSAISESLSNFLQREFRYLQTRCRSRHVAFPAATYSNRNTVHT